MSTATITELRYIDTERFNIAAESRKFDCKFIEPGLVSYRDVGGGLELLRKETLDRCMASAIGNPLIVGHTHVNAENRLALEEGVILDWHYNAEDGWFYVKGTADTESAKSRMRRGERPSCGYKVLALGPGGTYHGIRYDAEILDLQFNHLAIVDRPRYEDAHFRLNSKAMFKFLKRLITRENDAEGKPVEVIKTEAHEVAASTEVEVNGMKVRLNELFDTYMAETAAAFNAGPNDGIEAAGKVITMSELAAAHKKKLDRENALAAEKKEADEKAAAEKKATEERENALAAEKKAADDKEAAAKLERENGINAFKTLQAAASASAPADGSVAVSSGSLAEKVALGKKRY